jgi:ATP synthase in type III secretion protein N
VTFDFSRARHIVDQARTMRVTGRVSEVAGSILRAVIPGIRHGEMVLVSRTRGSELAAEVVGFCGDQAVLLPLGELEGVGPDSAVVPTGRSHAITCADSLLGRVVDGLGRPMDGGPAIGGSDWELWPLARPAPDPFSRRRVRRPMVTGVRVIDGLLTLAEGQRMGLFAAAGVGKSTLLGHIARGTAADVNVICLVGERGREVREFLEDDLGDDGRRRSVVVCATSDAPCLVRLKALFVATAIAEWFRDRRGRRVLLLVDSLTRFARAQREVGLSAGELPVRQGYPPSVFAVLPRLIERAGTSARGSVTAVYTVLVAGGDMDEAIADEVRGLLDGHVILDAEVAARGQFPAVDVGRSVSRVMPAVVADEHWRAAQSVREIIGTFEQHRELIALGAYQAGTSPAIDRAVERIGSVKRFLQQSTSELEGFAETVRRLAALT